ncbi:MAG: DUF763 domain-containing protein [Candidatus Scalindua sp.]|jgi:hypothetical protein|nr:DUF763 domain-containing protein [Candidatus Scalindua sp.]|tara:strand:- start:4605 stop:5846 length:1242 start_codon:yes stop_codon:yes gene_type:complete
MINSGMMGMPLHYGKMPKWLTERMGKMGSAIVESIVQNYGKSEVLTRLSNPNWFQAFGAVMGMQWNSSGVTAAVLGSLKGKINPMSSDLGIHILGGKGKYSYYAPNQIKRVSEKHGLKGDELVHACQLTRRVDNNAVQDGYNLYQQYFILTDEGEWTGITQGMNTTTRRARRYHWHSPTVRSFVDDPHKGIVGVKGDPIINLADSRADFARTNIVGLTKEKPSEVLEAYKSISLPNHHEVQESDVNMKRLGAVLQMAYNRDIDNFEDLLMLKGVGPKTLKSLALVSEVVHGDSSRFEDPARFSFAVGGKDGRPHPVDTESYDETIEILKDSVEKSKLGYSDKSKALKRLHKATMKTESNLSPFSFLEDLIEMEWKDAEKNGGMTFMGKTIKGITRAVMSIQNQILYDEKDKKN